jgi:hypothetical protein
VDRWPCTEGGYDYGLPTESQAALMGSVGKKLLEGATLAPEDVAKQLGRKMHNYGDYQSFGDLIIENAGGRAKSATIAANWISKPVWRG